MRYRLNSVQNAIRGKRYQSFHQGDFGKSLDAL